MNADAEKFRHVIQRSFSDEGSSGGIVVLAITRPTYGGE
jgi:hypothetical protein